MFILCSRKVGKWLVWLKGEPWWNKGLVQFVHAYFNFCARVEVDTFRINMYLLNMCLFQNFMTVSVEWYLSTRASKAGRSKQ